MGVSGLMKYIQTREDNILKPIVLNNTLVIIDGWNVCTYLYYAADYNDIYGGDYNQYAHYIHQFFDDLLKCKVTPLVILDGGWESKKNQNKIERAKYNIEQYANCSAGKKSSKFNPLLIGEVFVNEMKKMKIQYAMCIFEADDTVSSISKILNVPVLSNDSDYFIYGVDFIPSNTLDSNIVPYAGGYGKKCRIYCAKTLLNLFPGLDIITLPLASILLGNDFIKRNTFSEFLKNIKYERIKDVSERQCQIETVFQWLKDHSLNSAIAAILSHLPGEKRSTILQSIEEIINGYLNVSSYMLRPLGIEGKTGLNLQDHVKPFKFDANNGNSEDIDGVITDMKLHDNEVNEEKNDSHEQWTEEKFTSSVPQWFIDDLLAGKFPSTYVNILTHKMFMAPVQIEDFSKPSAIKISIPILRKIFSLLTTSRENKTNNANTFIQLFVREGITLNCYNLSVPLSPVAFEDIRNLSMIERKKIIDDTLNIHTNDYLDELPSSWQLYVAVILFWMRQDDGTDRTKFQLDALLVTMLIGIIDKNIGFQRLPTTNWRQSPDDINDEKKPDEAIDNDKSIVISNLIASVTKIDCVTAKRFFTDHAPKKLQDTFRVEIVHAFTQFQTCIRYAMNLNSLLGDVYVNPKPAEFLNGTLFYHFCIDFSTKSNVYNYIASKLKNSDSLMKVFMALNKKIRDALQNVITDEGVKI